MDCGDECAEFFPSLELGDLCSDTNPTPANNLCSDPVGKDSMVCGVKKLRNTPFSNYMSYANDSCLDSFTEQQAARMHCYIDLVYQSWQQEKTPPSFIPLPPRVTSKAKDKVTLTWIPPLGTGGANALNSCHECREDRVFQQYAKTATSSVPPKPNGYWSPHQATGAPDAKSCNLSPHGWSPVAHYEGGYIVFGFKEAVTPTSMSLWVVWNSKEGINDITLIFVDGTEKSLGNATAQCDSPLTMPLKVNKNVSKIRVHVKEMTVIDAIQLTSSVNHPNCRECEPIEYLVSRQPPFPPGRAQRVKATRFEDRHLIPGKSYTYKVKAVTSFGLEGPFSPPLVYSLAQGFCGDGIVEESIGEECDDGNVRDADGCNVQCKKEDVFHCTGHPSLCYRHDGDGICEDFERKTSIKDCGFYTPEGFEDQWAVNVSVNPRDRDETCPENVTLGPPPLDLVCQSGDKFINNAYAWRPCTRSFVSGSYWLEVTFNRSVVPAAVVLYIGSDGRTEYSLERTIKVELIDDAGRVHSSGGDETKLSCKVNPAVIPVHHDMTEPFFYVRKVRVSFKSHLIAIAGVALRSRTNFDVVELSKCGPEEIFSPRTQHCHNYLCERPSCHELVLKHATVKCEGTKEGQTCSVTCKTGYRPSKPFKMVCLNKEWQGISSGCVPINCGVPRIPNGQADCPDGHTFGKKCSFKCSPQAKLSGNGASVTCEADGKWSAQTAFCVMTCSKPVIPKNGEPLTGSSCFTSKGTILPGYSCKFRCKPGYRPKDRDGPARRALKVRCTKSGQWTHPSCEPIVCEKISASLLMWYNCSNGNALGSVCSSHCLGEGVHTVKCEDKGHWSEPMRRCKSRLAGVCPVPVPPPGVIITCEDHFPGGICKVQCKDSFHDVVEEGDEEKTLAIITCTKKSQWKPDPARLRCIPSCRLDYIEDEWCDKDNNNKHCRWDGGDCCASTTRNRIVRRVPTTCMSACDCKDPNAIENLHNKGGKDDEDDDDDDDRTGESGSDEELRTST